VYFQHSSSVWSGHPELVAGAVSVTGITKDAPVDDRIARFEAVAGDRLAGGAESELAEIQAWRRTFSRMGLKPTQYRCAAESLLRRFRKEHGLPRIHPLIDLCNAMSLASAIPIAVFDAARITGDLQVRHAEGDEIYETFSGETEHPEHGEVIFADSAGRAHARRWTNRQSGHSAVQEGTTAVLIVAEAVHATAGTDVRRLMDTIADELGAVWGVAPETAVLSAVSPRFAVAAND
jgi:DNA/RNA-binding domain of Phe-tRNA-synthetase-like protein